MMQLIKYPDKNTWKQILQRPYTDNSEVLQKVKTIFQQVKEKGDKALNLYTENFDGWRPEQLQVTGKEIEEAVHSLPASLISAIQLAGRNIERFHSAQLQPGEVVETMPGIMCWRKNVAIEKIGLYIPGGSAPLFSTVLMLGIPAVLAGCKNIIMCTPAGNSGKVHPAILYAASVTGIKTIFKLGGAQAVAAMTFGTESIPAVYKIFGPGNQYVTAGKLLAQMEGIAIDMPAGPSEVCVLADDSADPSYVASDLLSQAEHGADSQVLLVSDSETFIENCLAEIYKQVKFFPGNNKMLTALENSKAILVNNLMEGVDLVNHYAAEHLIINCRQNEKMATHIINAGSVFLGQYSPETAGDYASGTNHTLPTNGAARAYSGVSMDSFFKKITFQELSKTGLDGIANAVIEMAEAETLVAHAESIRKRMKSLNVEPNTKD